MAAMVGSSPIIPETAVTTQSAVLQRAASQSPYVPDKIFVGVSFTFSLSSLAYFSSKTAATSGLNSLICSSKREMFLFAESEDIFIPNSRATLRV